MKTSVAMLPEPRDPEKWKDAPEANESSQLAGERTNDLSTVLQLMVDRIRELDATVAERDATITYRKPKNIAQDMALGIPALRERVPK